MASDLAWRGDGVLQPHSHTGLNPARVFAKRAGAVCWAALTT